MEWLLLLIGAVLGVAVDNVYDWARRRGEERRRAHHYRALNDKHGETQSLHPNLHLVQAGWDPSGFYSAGAITIRARGSFEGSTAITGLMEQHEAQWIASGASNLPQIGLRSFRIDRVSDDPADERAGTAHRLTLQGRTYQYFEFLASHRLLLQGTDAERAIIAGLGTNATLTSPAPSLPTPLSVGLTLIAEQGAFLMLSRRATTQSHAGTWAGGRVFNAVGEGVAPRDLASAGYDADTTSPEVTAARGLYEEVGFRTQDMVRTQVRLHSFAFDSDLLDYKFFGVAETSLSASQVILRWEVAPDRAEASELIGIPIRNRGECLALVARLVEEQAEWSSEALFCTIRTLLCLELVRVQDLIEALGRRNSKAR